MVQEVQVWVGITNETTLETIEAVGTSSVKIREWRQTTPRFSSWCKATWQVTWQYTSSIGERDSGLVKSNDTEILENNGNAEYIIRDGGIRVPHAWTYSITVYWGAAWNYLHTLIIKWADKIIYQKTAPTWSSWTETAVASANLGKFDLIEICGEFYYSGSASAATLTFATKPQLTITQL